MTDFTEGNGWLDAESIGSYWSNAPTSPLIDDLLDSARRAIEKELRSIKIAVPAPAAGDVVEIPVVSSWRIAQAMQARASWEAQRANPNDDTMGGGDMQARIYPMSAAIRRLIASGGDAGIVVG